MKELESMQKDSLHFSSSIALSLGDARTVRQTLLKVIADVEAILVPSPEETVRIFNIDFFEPGHSSEFF